jgi:hypothetical protein
MLLHTSGFHRPENQDLLPQSISPHLWQSWERIPCILRIFEALIILLSLVCRKSEMPINYFHGERFATVSHALSGNWTIRKNGDGFREGRAGQPPV